MASRLEGRVARAEQKLTPSGGHNIVKAILEAAGHDYVYDPSHEFVTLLDLVTQVNAAWCAELEAQKAAARAPAENIVPLRRPHETSGRAFAVDGYPTLSEPEQAPLGPSPRPTEVPGRLRLPPGWSQD